LPGWQQFYARHRGENFALISIAVEHNDPGAVRSFVEAAGATFPTAIDETGLTGAAFGFKVVPNGVLIDPEGIVRYAKFGGFSIENRSDVEAVERFQAGQDPGASPESGPPYVLGRVENELVETKLRLGRLLAAHGQRGEAVAEWQAALRLDPKNFTIRKQIWVARHPEKFFPTIDFSWQREQLAQEQAEEFAAGLCGPDGCPIPR
jgi:AhpC/TSA family